MATSTPCGLRSSMEVVLEEAQREFERLMHRTLERLRSAMEKELADAKADLAKKEQALRQEATLSLTGPQSAASAAASTPTPMRSMAASAYRQDLGDARGTASQLRALFERKAAKHEPNRLSSPRKEKVSDHNRLSFRAQEGMLRRRSSIQSASEERKMSPSPCVAALVAQDGPSPRRPVLSPSQQRLLGTQHSTSVSSPSQAAAGPREDYLASSA
mmetsp:Transcript_63494/g.100940  ORF Transcript_63494/g.100940 Transcript_63494/m.100940 type:complete len:216 (+) Transcript_63494:40-687(+)